MTVLKNDLDQARACSTNLQNIGQDVQTILGQYLQRNQDLTGVGFGGNAAQASLLSAGELHQQGMRTAVQWEQMVDGINKSITHYQIAEEQSTAALKSVV